MIAFLLSMIAYKWAMERAGYVGTVNGLFDKLSKIRLATFIENPPKKSRGRYKVSYQLEEMEKDIKELAEKLGITELKLKKNIPFSVYI